MRIRSLFLAAAILLTGCTTVVAVDQLPNYQIGEEKSANIGAPFFIARQGTVSTVRRWVGTMNSADGWATDYVGSPGYLKQELLYSGKTGNTIEISYREFRGGLAAPAFFQTVKYDLSQSNTITFQRFRFEVLFADNQSIRTRLIADQ